MPASAAEQLATQTVRAIQGLNARFQEILAELPDDRKEYWLNRLAEELNAIDGFTVEHTNEVGVSAKSKK